MVAPAILYGLRGVQTVLAVIVLGLTVYLTSTTYPYAPYASLPGSIPFMLFTSIFSLLALAYLVLAPKRLAHTALSHHYVMAGVEVLTMIFWFAAFVAVAVRWGSGDFLVGRKWTFWDVGVADAVLSAFLWVTFVVTTVLTVLHVRRSSSKGVGSV